jgi:hypothetical protein
MLFLFYLHVGLLDVFGLITYKVVEFKMCMFTESYILNFYCI